MAGHRGAKPAQGSAGFCTVLCFTGPFARLPNHLATLRRSGLALDVRRCKTLLDFARELKDCPLAVVAIDCGPGNPRLAEAVAIFRRARGTAPLVLLSEDTPELRDVVAGLGGCHTFAPSDLQGLATLIRKLCGRTDSHPTGAPHRTSTPMPPAATPLIPLADRETLLQALRRALLANAAHAVLAVVQVGPEPPAATLERLHQIIREACGVQTPLANLGDRRFGALLELADLAKGVALANDVRERILGRLRDGAPVDAPISVALGLSPPRTTDGSDPEIWLARAIQACDVALRTEHGYAVLNRTPVTTPSARDLPSLIQEALVGDRLVLQFQPIVSLRGDAREHYETLLRLFSPTVGELLPADFFGAAQASGLMSAIDHWVIRHVIPRLANERRKNRRVHLFVPLSAQGLADDRLLLAVCDRLRDAQASGDWLTFQLRPLDVRSHPRKTRRLVDGLQKIKCRLALDRYDGEPSSREVLAAIPFEFAKLHPSVTRDLHSDPVRLERLSAIVSHLGKRGVKSVATGVEDRQNLAYLWAAGVDYAQGFFLQEPTDIISYETAS